MFTGRFGAAWLGVSEDCGGSLASGMPDLSFSVLSVSASGTLDGWSGPFCVGDESIFFVVNFWAFEVEGSGSSSVVLVRMATWRLFVSTVLTREVIFS
jgi:ABC-type uncharacterized transport system permease subunit